MRISSLGEFGLIERIKRPIKTDSSVIKASGDDCAVLKFDKNNYLLLTCDMLVEGVDFTRGDDPYLIGRKAVGVSISDIAACAGRPRYCLVSIGLPKDTRVNFVDRLSRGMREMARIYGVNIAGGDLSRAKELVIDVSMYGVVEKKNLVLRSGAKNKDIILVSGEFGGSISGRHLKFTPRVKEAGFLARNFKITSMIDVSDGLIQDLHQILQASEAGAVIFQDLIPVSNSAKCPDAALYSGEDFELLFTMPLKEAKRLVFKRPALFSPIGEIIKKGSGIKMIDKNNREKMIQPKGFRHF